MTSLPRISRTSPRFVHQLHLLVLRTNDLGLDGFIFRRDAVEGRPVLVFVQEHHVPIITPHRVSGQDVATGRSHFRCYGDRSAHTMPPISSTNLPVARSSTPSNDNMP